MKSIIHVNQQVIARNRKTGSNDPPLIVRTYRGSKKVHSIEILGPSKVVNSPHKPLKCGARVWIRDTRRGKSEPVTTDTRISFVNRYGQLIVFDLPVSCQYCERCLMNRQSGICLYGLRPDGLLAQSNTNKVAQEADSS